MNLKDAPDFPKQPFCPVCGRTDLPMEGHHVIHRSQNPNKGQEDYQEGPVIYICKACHARHHDLGDLEFEYDELNRWVHLQKFQNPYNDWVVNEFRVYNEFDQEVPFDEPDLGELSNLLDLQHKMDYLIGVEVAGLIDTHGADYLADVLVSLFDFNARSVKNYIRKRARHGRMLTPFASQLNVNAANLICDIVSSTQSDEHAVAYHYLTMPKAQFNEAYGIETKRKRKECPNCGADL